MASRRHIKIPVAPGNAAPGSGRWCDLDFGGEVHTDRGDSKVNPFCPIDRCDYLKVPHVDGDTRHRVYPRVVPGDVVESVEAERGPDGWVWVVTLVGMDLDDTGETDGE